MSKVNFLKELFGTKKYRLNKLSYDAYWEERRPYGHAKTEPKKRDIIIKNLIKPGSKVLDIGCGDGRLMYYLQNTNSNHCVGLDCSPTAIRIAQNLGLKAKLTGNLEKRLEKEGVHDYIVMSEFIEHIADPESIMQKIYDKFNESIIITFPNVGHFVYRLRLVFGRFPECWKWYPGEHVRYWTKRDFKKWIERDDNNFASLRLHKILGVEGTPLLKNLSDSLFSYSFVAELKK